MNNLVIPSLSAAQTAEGWCCVGEAGGEAKMEASDPDPDVDEEEAIFTGWLIVI